MRKFLKKAENVAKKLDKELSKNVLGLEEGHRISHLVNTNSIKHKDALNDFKGKNSLDNNEPVLDADLKSYQDEEFMKNSSVTVYSSDGQYDPNQNQTSPEFEKDSFSKDRKTQDKLKQQESQHTVEANSNLNVIAKEKGDIFSFINQLFIDGSLTEVTKDQLPLYNQEDAKLIVSTIISEAQERGIEALGAKITGELHIFAPELF